MATLQQLINKSNDAPRDISATNYLDTDPTIGLVAKQNEQIDDNIKDFEQATQQKIDLFNTAHKTDMDNLGKIIDFLPDAKRIVDNRKTFRDNENLIGDLLKASEEAKQDDAIDVYAEDIDNEYNTELQGAVGELEANNGPKFAKNVALLSTLNSDGLNTRNTLEKYAGLTNAFYSQAKLTLRLPDGRGYGDLVTPDDINQFERHAAGILLGNIMDEHPEITRREVIKHWLPKYKDGRTNFIRQWSNNQDRISTDAYKKGEQIRRWDSTHGVDPVGAAFGPNGFIIQRAAYFEALVPGKGLRFAREEWVADMVEGAKGGYVQDVNTLLSTPVKWNDGSMMSFDKKFPVDATKIRTAYIKGQTREYEEIKDKREAEEDLWLFERVEQYDGKRDNEWKKNLFLDYSSKFRTTEFPEELKTIWTESYEDEYEKVKRLQHIASNGGRITQEDIATIDNPTLYDAAAKLVNTTTVGGVPTEINKESEGLIKSYVAKHTFENDLTKSQTPKFKAIQLQANKAFRAKFAELKGQNQSDEMAQLGALEYVQAQIKDQKFDKLPEYKYNLSSAHDLNIARTSLIVDKELIASSELLEGEKTYLDEGEKFVKSNYKRGKVPEYYRQLSKLYPDLDPHDFMMQRLQATGRVKDTDNRYEGVENPRDFTDKPTSSKIYRNALTTDNMDWLLQNIINPVNASNGGFDAVTKNGKFVELEKPLSEHTIGEVLALTREYDNFGMFNLTAGGLSQILTSPDLPFDLDDPFNEDTQKALVLGRLKQKANMGHGLNGMPGFKRIVNVLREDENRFYEIVGELPPMNQLGNLLPGVAKALVEDTLQ